MIDEIDEKILTILQENARTSNAEVARQLGMAPSAILERIRKLEERGVIEGYVARVNPEAYGLWLTAYVFVRADERAGATATAQRLAAIREVQEVHHVAGEDCFLVKVRTAGTRALGELLRKEFGEIETIRSTRSTIVMDTIKESWTVPAPARGEVEDGG
ncbi:MAG TPA: Lrp/AsnC family transcriptional regulator [Longimicrobiaceae bacterium]|jgi:Lrp/AsnC family leucine-responsive transcriptional regulator|nr:Lrp/AsnC family transcriptional regulator [Longimicrobiaceae bacterium]